MNDVQLCKALGEYLKAGLSDFLPVSYTHLTLPTNSRV